MPLNHVQYVYLRLFSLIGQASINFKDILSCYSTGYIWKANGGSVFDPDNNSNSLLSATVGRGLQYMLSIYLL